MIAGIKSKFVTPNYYLISVGNLKSVNLQYDKLGRWDDGLNESLTKSLMFQVFFPDFLQNSLQKSFQFIFLFFYYSKEIKIKSFECPKYKKQ
jgi:hypothetical protein